MTNEEAIKVLRTESVELGGSAVSVCRFLEALDMAVKALKDVPDKDVWKMTNAQRIRAMSDEELAEALYSRTCPPNMYETPCLSYHCKECWMKWLQMSAEDDSHE